jgi:capsular exopolysaccharide synthesis family protein
VTSELTLRDYVEILRRRAWIVALCFLGALAAALAWSALQTPMHQSSARVLINQAASTDIFDPTSGSTSNTSFADRQTTTAVELIESQLVDDEAESRLGFEAEIKASAAARADIVVLTATDADPARAQLVAQTYADAYLDIRRTEFTQERLSTAEDLLIRIAELDIEIDGLDPGAPSGRTQTLRDDLADSYDRLVISANLGNSGSARIIDQADLSKSPFSPRTNRNMALGGVLGLMLGAGAALLLESLDTSIKSRQVIEEITPGLPVLASISAMASEHKVVAVERPDGLETEVFRMLRASIEFAAVDRPITMIQVTSAGASAGKTTVAANLAVVMAQSGQRVAIIDCDLRRPRLHSMFDIEQVPGISSVIIGRSSSAEASHSVHLNNGRLWIFPSGPIPPGPSELLGSERARATLNGLRKSVDVVIIDSPPVLPVSDALVLSRLVDATVVVANARSTKREDLVRTLDQLDQAGANVIGTVLNQVKANTNHGYGYGYGHGYGHGEGARGGLFGRSSNVPHLEGTAVLASADLPRFEVARPDSRAQPVTGGFADAYSGPSWLQGPSPKPNDTAPAQVVSATAPPKPGLAKKPKAETASSRAKKRRRRSELNGQRDEPKSSAEVASVTPVPLVDSEIDALRNGLEEKDAVKRPDLSDEKPEGHSDQTEVN